MHKDEEGNLLDATQWNYTYYVRDAGANVMDVITGTGPGAYTDEVNLYGSSRLGTWQVNEPEEYNSGYLAALGDDYRLVGHKNYELTNHLGNVMVTVSDKKRGIDENADDVADYYLADVTSAQDYYPFGMLMSGRSYQPGGHRYGFNGKEKDDEVKGAGNSIDFGARIHDPRLGRFLSIDPRVSEFLDLSPYAYAANNPIYYIDEDGEGPTPLTTKGLKEMASRLGIVGNKRIGEFFERAAMSAVTNRNILVVHNTLLNFYSEMRFKRNGGNPSSVRPDGITFSSVIDLVKYDVKAALASFYEVKATKSTITIGYRRGQIEGMVDVAETKAKRAASLTEL